MLIIADYPTTTKWLSEEEKYLAVARLQMAEDNEEEHMSHRVAFVQALKDPKTWVRADHPVLRIVAHSCQTFMLAYNVLNSVGTISYFFPTLMTGLGYKGRTAQCT
jgi:hypothetical protein